MKEGREGGREKKKNCSKRILNFFTLCTSSIKLIPDQLWEANKTFKYKGANTNTDRTRTKCHVKILTIPFQMKYCLSKHLVWSQHKKSNHQHMQDRPQPKHAMPRQPQCVPSHKFAINIQLPWKPYKCKNQKSQSTEIKNTIIIKCRKKWQQVKIGKHNRKMNFSYPGPPRSKILAFLLVLYLHQSEKKGETLSLQISLYQAHILIVVQMPHASSSSLLLAFILYFALFLVSLKSMFF